MASVGIARETLRRVAIIRAAQVFGLTLEEIRAALNELPAREPRKNTTGNVSPRRGAAPLTPALLSLKRSGTDFPDASAADASRLNAALSSIPATGLPTLGPVPSTYFGEVLPLNPWPVILG